MTAAKEYWEKFLENYFESKGEVCELNENVGKYMEEYAQLKAEHELKRLYDWLMDENREPAQTFFTAGELRNVAKEIEFRLQKDIHFPSADEIKDMFPILDGMTVYGHNNMAQMRRGAWEVVEKMKNNRRTV